MSQQINLQSGKHQRQNSLVTNLLALNLCFFASGCEKQGSNSFAAEGGDNIGAVESDNGVQPVEIIAEEGSALIDLKSAELSSFSALDELEVEWKETVSSRIEQIAKTQTREMLEEKLSDDELLLISNFQKAQDKIDNMLDLLIEQEDNRKFFLAVEEMKESFEETVNTLDLFDHTEMAEILTRMSMDMKEFITFKKSLISAYQYADHTCTYQFVKSLKDNNVFDPNPKRFTLETQRVIDLNRDLRLFESAVLNGINPEIFQQRIVKDLVMKYSQGEDSVMEQISAMGSEPKVTAEEVVPNVTAEEVLLNQR